jgi:hypothetical protein
VAAYGWLPAFDKIRKPPCNGKPLMLLTNNKMNIWKKNRPKIGQNDLIAKYSSFVIRNYRKRNKNIVFYFKEPNICVENFSTIPK